MIRARRAGPVTLASINRRESSPGLCFSAASGHCPRARGLESLCEKYQRTLLLVLVLVLVLENSCKIEDEDEKKDDDEPVRGVFHTGSKRRAPLRFQATAVACSSASFR
jgi:hypothetical protein